MLIYTCPACGRETMLPPDRLGTVIVCPNCLDKGTVSEERIRRMGEPAARSEADPPSALPAKPQSVEVRRVADAERETETTAILALVTGVGGLLSPLCCLFGLAGVAAVVMGLVAHGRINADPRRLSGKKMATIGIILGGTGALVMLLMYVLLAMGVVKGRFGR